MSSQVSYLNPAQLQRDLGIRDLSDPAEGPHAIQVLIRLAVEGLCRAWGCEVRWCRGSRIVPVADNYDRLGYAVEAVTRESLLDALTPRWPHRQQPRTHPYTLAGRQIDLRHGGRWVEVGECGLAHPGVLTAAGLPGRSGLALGMGLDRLLMLAKRIPRLASAYLPARRPARDHRQSGEPARGLEVAIHAKHRCSSPEPPVSPL